MNKSLNADDDPAILKLLAVSYAELEQWEEAAHWSEVELARLEQTSGDSHPGLQDPLGRLLLALSNLNRRDQMLPLVRRMVRLCEQHHGTDAEMTRQYRMMLSALESPQ